MKWPQHAVLSQVRGRVDIRSLGDGYRLEGGHMRGGGHRLEVGLVTGWEVSPAERWQKAGKLRQARMYSQAGRRWSLA